ncbi:MAG: hypothetical protein HWE15_07550 [Algoriphagus sp.]|uniref:hypothetical protein n=1 Tax=Algoriphagus sp. TaxID=1872435 RepID=UPI00185A2524|nr:hypothetical protein [Algoriphagus sp.]NVJ86145.1 hypothetical protein [Algoriphagus sp.]
MKIGMEVIYFSQEKLSNEGSAAWKRLKNGDVQILTSNQSKHQVWTIHDNGRLKMESLLHENKDEASLSFEFLNSQVNQLSWLGGKNIEKSIKYPLNESFSPIETNNIQFVMVEFTNVTLKVTPEFKPVGFRFLGGTDGALTFERNTIKTSTSQSESPDGISGKDQGDGVDEKALVLWFDFK